MGMSMNSVFKGTIHYRNYKPQICRILNSQVPTSQALGLWILQGSY